MATRVRKSELTLAQFRTIEGFESGARLAEAAKLPRSTIARMENGNDDSLAARETLAATLGISVRQLHGYIDRSRAARRVCDLAEIKNRDE